MSADEKIHDILRKSKTIAVYGMSTNTSKPAHSVPVFLQSKGYTILPINPGAEMIAGRRCYSTLRGVKEKIDVLEVFRPSDQVLDVVRESIERRRAKGDIDVMWLQLGIQSDAARTVAEKEGITFIENKCMKMEHQRLFPDR